jgi:hypothetical protein
MKKVITVNVFPGNGDYTKIKDLDSDNDTLDEDEE